MRNTAFIAVFFMMCSLACTQVQPLPLLTPAETTYDASLGVDLAAMQKQASGLYVQDLVEGSGEASQSGDSVSVDYTGWLPTGDKFDSSIGRAPFSFTLGAGRVIRGWDEGVVGMKVGGTRRLVIPSQLGYGVEGAGAIPGNAVLVFDVEMKAIE